MTNHPSPSQSERGETYRPFLVLLFQLLLLSLSTGAVLAASKAAPWTAVALSVLAVPAWATWGPSPMPGQTNGFLCLGGMLAILGVGVVTLVRALYGTFAG